MCRDVIDLVWLMRMLIRSVVGGGVTGWWWRLGGGGVAIVVIIYMIQFTATVGAGAR